MILDSHPGSMFVLKKITPYFSTCFENQLRETHTQEPKEKIRLSLLFLSKLLYYVALGLLPKWACQYFIHE